MQEKKLELTLTEELYQELQRITEAAGTDDLAAAASAGLAQWIGWRTAELDARDPTQKYFINEALDELLSSKK
ncbi:MAG: hypothetical protein ACREQT_00030 [Candidatus Binataceae bacterium]